MNHQVPLPRTSFWIYFKRWNYHENVFSPFCNRVSLYISAHILRTNVSTISGFDRLCAIALHLFYALKWSWNVFSLFRVSLYIINAHMLRINALIISGFHKSYAIVLDLFYALKSLWNAFSPFRNKISLYINAHILRTKISSQRFSFRTCFKHWNHHEKYLVYFVLKSIDISINGSMG